MKCRKTPPDFQPAQIELELQHPFPKQTFCPDHNFSQPASVQCLLFILIEAVGSGDGLIDKWPHGEMDGWIHLPLTSFLNMCTRLIFFSLPIFWINHGKATLCGKRKKEKSHLKHTHKKGRNYQHIYHEKKKMFTCYPVPNEKGWKFKRNFSSLFFAIHRRVSFSSSFFPWKSERMLEDKETKQQTKCHCVVVAIHGKTLVSLLAPHS